MKSDCLNKALGSLRPAGDSAGAQVAGQVLAELASGLDEQRLIDRFVRHPHLQIIGELAPQPAGDLLGTEPSLQLCHHLRQQATTTAQHGLLGTLHRLLVVALRSQRLGQVAHLQCTGNPGGWIGVGDQQQAHQYRFQTTRFT